MPERTCYCHSRAAAEHLILCGRLLKFCEYHNEEVALQMVHLLVSLLQHIFTVHCGRQKKQLIKPADPSKTNNLLIHTIN